MAYESEMIPAVRREGVDNALRSAFGASPASDFQPITGGVSGALICRFHVQGRAYALRLEPERIALHDRQRGFDCMVAAAGVGAAPPVRYADPASGVAIMDYVSSRPLSDYPGGPAAMTRALGRLLADVRTTAPFPMGDYPQAIQIMLGDLSASILFTAGALGPHAEGLARIQDALPWDRSSLVSSHNDPNPRNILFDGDRLWLIDWELAFRNDPLVDVAILTTDLAETPELEDILLAATFDREPDRRVRARLRVIRLLTRLFYGCIVLENFVGADPSAQPDSLAALTPAGFRGAVAEGRLGSGAPETAYAFGKMSLAAFIDGLAAPGFDEALRMASQG